MRNVIEREIVGNTAESIWQKTLTATFLRAYRDKFRTAFSSMQRPIWAEQGAMLHRAAQALEVHENDAVRPLKQTIGDVIVFGAAVNHSLALQSQVAGRFPRSAAWSEASAAASTTAYPVNRIASDRHTSASNIMPLASVSASAPPAWGGADTSPDVDLPDVHVMLLLTTRGYAIDQSQSASVNAQLLRAAVDMLIKHPESEGELTKKIIRDLGYYGGFDREPVVNSYKSKMLRDWVEKMSFDGSIEDFIIKHLSTHDGASDLTTSTLRQLISTQIYQKQWSADLDGGNMEKDAMIKDWIWHNVVLEALPLLALAKSSPAESLAMSNVNWGKMHAGFALASQVGMDLKHVSEEDALDLGKLLLAALGAGTLPAEWGILFRLPARFFSVLSPAARVNEDDALASRLQHYFDACDHVLEAQSPMLTFQRLVGAFKTRPQLAQQLIDSRCPGASLTNFLNFGESTCWSTPQLPQSTLKNLYQKQIDEIAAAFKELDQLMLVAAWGSLKDDDMAFVLQAEIQKMQVSFSATHRFRAVVTRTGAALPPEQLQIPLRQNIDVFAARHQGEERIYAVIKRDNEYTLKQVDRKPERYHELMHTGKPGIDHDYRLIVNGDGAPLRPNGRTLDALCEEFARQHQKKFSSDLYGFGYEKTSLEKVGSALLSLIPGYTCINEARGGNQGAAALACSIDVLSLVPVAGKLASMSTKVGQAFYNGGVRAIGKASNELAARSSMQIVLREGGREFALHGMLPAKTALGYRAWQSLGITVARSLDPGVELFGRMGFLAVERLISLGQRMEKYFPSLRHTLKKIDNREPKLQENAWNTEIVHGRLPGIEHDIDLIKLKEKTSKGRSVYVQVDPDTREPFGKKYRRSGDGRLRPIHISVAQRVQRMREQGLGGKGALKAAASFASTNPVHTVELPSVAGAPGGKVTLQVGPVKLLERLANLGQAQIENVGGLRALANLHEVELAWLSRFLEPNGTLTARGRDLIDGYYISRWLALSSSQRKLLTIKSFTQENQLSYDRWLALISVKNGLQPGGYEVLARMETGTQFPPPSAELLEQWIALPEGMRKNIGPSKFAVEHSVSPLSFSKQLEHLQRTATIVPKQRQPAPQAELAVQETNQLRQQHEMPGTSGNVAARSNAEVPAGVSLGKHQSAPEGVHAQQSKRQRTEAGQTMVSGSGAIMSTGIQGPELAKGGSQASVWRARSGSGPGSQTQTPEPSQESYGQITYEHIKVWRDLLPEQRRHWTISEFGRQNNVNPNSMKAWLRVSGEMAPLGSRLEIRLFGEEIDQASNEQLTVMTLKALSDEWREKGTQALAEAGGIRQLALDRRINPNLLSRYLDQHGFLTEEAKRWINIADNELQRRPALQTNLVMRTRWNRELITYEHIKVWQDMTDEQRSAWNLGQFARACNLSESVWHQCVSPLGEIRPQGSWIESKTLAPLGFSESGTSFNIAALLALQPLAAEGIAVAGSLKAFGILHGLNETTVQRYFNVNGTLTQAGQRLQELFGMSKLKPEQYRAIKARQAAASQPSSLAGNDAGGNRPLQERSQSVARATTVQAVEHAAAQVTPRGIVRPWEDSPGDRSSSAQRQVFPGPMGGSPSVRTEARDERGYRAEASQSGSVDVMIGSDIVASPRDHDFGVGRSSEGSNQARMTARQWNDFSEYNALVGGPRWEHSPANPASGDVPNETVRAAGRGMQAVGEIQDPHVSSGSGNEPSAGLPSAVTNAFSPARRAQLNAIDNSLPSLQDPENPRMSVLNQVEMPIEQLTVSNWADLYQIFDQMPAIAAQQSMATITEAVRQWLRNDGAHAARLDATLQVMPQSGNTDSTFGVISRRQIEQFEVIGSYSGALLNSEAALRRELRTRGDDNVYLFLWQTPNPEINLSAYGRGNLLSLISSGDPRIGAAAEQNLVPIRVGNNLVFYVASRTIAPGEELLVTIGDRFGPAW